MDSFEDLILRWVCLFDNFDDFKQSNIKNLVSSTTFKEFVDNVFCLKCSTPSMTDNEKLYNTIKANYQEFEVKKYEDICNEENSVYTCIVVLLHALLKCTNGKYRNQLSEKMDDDEQVLLATFLEATQTSLFTKRNISDALMTTNGKKLPNLNVSESFSSNTTPIKPKSMRRSYLQEFCESPKSQSLIYQEKEKLIAKLTDDIKNECEENDRLAENVKMLEDVNLKLSNKLEDKEKIIQFLKDEIEELSQPKDPSFTKVDNSLTIKQLNQDILYLETNNNELKQQLLELENKHKVLNAKFGKKSSSCENLLLTFDSVESENMLLKENINALKITLQEKDIEITSLKDELCNKSITSNAMNLSSGTNIASSNTLFDELSCLKLEEVTHDKEKYRHKYKSVKKDLLNTENHVKDLDEQILTFKEQLQDSEIQKDKLLNKFSEKKKELLECQKKNNNLETKIKHLKDSVKDKENSIESMSIKLDKKENKIKELLVELDSVKKAKTMIELILSKTNTEIETLHEENEKTLNDLLTAIEDYKKSDEVSHKHVANLENEMKQIKDNLENKADIITFYENKAAEYYQNSELQEEQLRTLYQEKLTLQSHLKDMKTKDETQEKLFKNKIRDMENTLEYHLDELKDVKNNVSKLNEILICKQNEIDQQNELVNYQKNITETLQSDKCNLEIHIKNLNNVVEQKSIENKDLKEKIQESTLNLNIYKEQLNAALNEKSLLEENVNSNELQIKSSNEQFKCQFNDMKNRLESQCDEINQFKIDIEKLKCIVEEKQNDFNEQLIINNKHIESISQLQLGKKDLEAKLKSSDQSILNKGNELKSLKEKLNQSTLKIKNLSEKVKIVIKENNLLTKNLNMMTSIIIDMQKDFDNQLLNMKTKVDLHDNKMHVHTENVFKLKNCLVAKMNELNIQIDVGSKQKDHILSLENKQLDLFQKLEVLDQCLLNKDTLIVNLEKELKVNDSFIVDLKEQLGVMRIEKVMIEANLNETSDYFKNSQKQFTDQINDLSDQLNNGNEEIMKLKNQSSETENILREKEKEINEHVELNTKQNEIIEKLTSEKEILEEQILNANEYSIKIQSEVESLHEKLNKYQFSNLKLEKDLETLSIEKIAFETKLKNTIQEKEKLNQHFDKQIQEVKNCLKDTSIENNDLKKYISDLKNDINIKHVQIEHSTEEKNQLKKIIDYSENQCINLQDKLKELNDCLLEKEESIDLMKTQISECSTLNENLQEQVIEVKQNLNEKYKELENQIQWCNEQREIIVKIKNEKESLHNEIKSLESLLSHKEYEFNLSEGKLYDSSNTINDLEKKLNDMKNEKSSLEMQLNKTITQLTNKIHDLSLQLELEGKNILNIQEELILGQNKFQQLMEQSNEQTKTISFLNAEKTALLEEISKLHVSLNENDNTLKCVHEKINDYKMKNEELQTLSTHLSSELDENKILLTNIQQESNKQLTDMETKYIEVKDQLNKKEIELAEYISKYDCQIETTDTLMRERDNLIEETNKLKNTVLDKDSIIATNQEKLLEYKEQNNTINNDKISLEIKLKQTNDELEIARQDLTQKLEEMNKKLNGLHEELNSNYLDLELQEIKAEEQLAIISELTSEKYDLTNDTNALKDYLLEKENALTANNLELIKYQTQLKELLSLKIVLESELSETKVQLDNTQHDLTQQLETSNNKLSEIQEQLSKLQIVLDNQNKCSNDKLELINTLMSEKNSLIDETNKLKEYLAQNENRLQIVEKRNKEIENKKATLMSELKQLKYQLNDLRQESTKQIFEISTKFCEAQEKLNLQQSDIKNHVEHKNDGLSDIYQEINDLKTMKNELELLFNKQRTDFDTQFETCSYSINCITNKSLLNQHENSLMEVITSADTFMEQNGIQIAQIENADDNSIMEKIKKLFEAFKMFIIYINTQSNEQAISNTNTVNGSNEAYDELLATSKKQQETITNLVNEMSRLKSECNHKVSKVQQKTQEYVTSEYEKKFERKREQMKQFCKDLETKMHQDYEAKLMKYKEKINKDEIHIKELGQQLWDVSEKFLKLQQQNRRESTMSLPYEIPSFSQTTNFPHFNSFTLPKASSASQIRSLVDENTRSYQDHSRRNLPAGIGKKFSLSSGKIFPKEEDEEGEMFNHSCLADLKQGRVNLNDTNSKQCNERLSELQARNSLCPPHLRSCYAVETNFLPSPLITEEDIKATINYSDCESENLIPQDRNKKKDRNQTSYKKPGPPTPSKNGGRVSLLGNQKPTLKESKETANANKRRTSSTPNKLFSLFMSKK